MFINALKINNPKVRKLSFSIDLQHFLRYNEENIEFLPDSAYHYMDEQAWLTFSSGLRDLGTLELHHPENKQFWTKYLKKDPAKMLEFTLSNIDQTDCSRPAKTNKDYNYSPLLKCLEECSNLKALRFERSSSSIFRSPLRREAPDQNNREKPQDPDLHGQRVP